MPARKPSLLIPINETKEERSARVAAEKRMIPKDDLSIKSPAALSGHKLAAGTWKKVVNLYASVDGKIATGFDEDLLIQYCLLIEEIPWLGAMRNTVEDEYKSIQKQVTKLRNSKLSDESYKTYLRLLEQQNALLARIQGLDSRLDGKRKLVHSLSQSLYLTPRSRAGVAPPVKETESPKSDMAKLLSD